MQSVSPTDPSPLQTAIRDALRAVKDPDLHRDIVALGFVKSIIEHGGGRVTVTVELTTPACPVKDMLKAECEDAIKAVPGITEANVVMTANVKASNPAAGKAPISGIRNIIAVASGKGGVGKSTTSVNLAVALSKLGARVALLDADIYGPNIPGMVGAKGRPNVVENRILPITASGLTVMSMGFMVNDDQPLVWRGPMLHGVLKQLLHDVRWGDHDYLVIDLPPGTGDVQLSLIQSVPLAGAVIVTTPQNVALQDVRKGIVMFQQSKVPIIGLIENMSYYLCPSCGHRDEIFSTDGGEEAARTHGLNFLGRVPLNTNIRKASDAGTPLALDPDSQFGGIYRDIAMKVAQQVSILAATQPADAATDTPAPQEAHR